MYKIVVHEMNRFGAFHSTVSRMLSEEDKSTILSVCMICSTGVISL